MYVILTSKPGQFRTEAVKGLRPTEAYDYVFYGHTKAHFVIAELLGERTNIRVIEDGTAIVNDVPSKFLGKFESHIAQQPAGTATEREAVFHGALDHRSTRICLPNASPLPGLARSAEPWRASLLTDCPASRSPALRPGTKGKRRPGSIAKASPAR